MTADANPGGNSAQGSYLLTFATPIPGNLRIRWEGRTVRDNHNERHKNNVGNRR